MSAQNIDIIALTMFPFLMIGALILVYYANKWRFEYLYEKYRNKRSIYDEEI